MLLSKLGHHQGQVRILLFRITLNLLIASDGKAKFVINQSSEYKNI